MPGLGVFFQLFPQEPVSTHCQLVCGELHDKLTELHSASEKEPGTVGMLKYLRTIHEHAIACPRTNVANVDTHYASQLAAANLYHKAYFTESRLAPSEGETVKQLIASRSQEDHTAFKSELSWGQWLARVATQRPRYS
jgi:hypothetical protein